MKNKKRLIIIVGVAILIKFFLLLFVELYVPQSKFMPDSSGYLKTAEMLTSKGTFAIQDTGGSLKYELNRTPGYPFFLAILHGFMRIPLSGVIFIQVILTILAAFITYKTAVQIDPKLGFLSAAIVLYSPTLSIFSLMILTESLFLFLITLFMFNFVQYLKSGNIKLLILSSLMLVLAAYVRPGGYLLGLITALFILYANVPRDIKKAAYHALVFIMVVYGLLGIWQVRNYMVFGNPTFSSILQEDPVEFGLLKSYSRNTDPLTTGMGPLQYYISVVWRCFLSLMTRPGSFKYFHYDSLTVFGKILGYPWVVFWMSGLLYGIVKMGRNIYFQFLLLIIVCFICGSIIGELWFVGARFRIPMTPFIAIISAYGWMRLISLAKREIRWEGVWGRINKIVRRLLLTAWFILVVVVGFGIWAKDKYVVPIMMYHSISLGSKDLFNRVTPKVFAQQMDFLEKNGYKVISLDDLVGGIKGGKKFPHKTVVITFDDGISDNYFYAFSILKRHHFPATIFVISDSVGLTGFLTWNQIKEMSRYDIVIGSHTRRHAYLPPLSEAQLRDEIQGSKRIIEEHLGKKVDFFAYPSGGFTEQIKSILKESGYKAAFTTNRGYDRRNVDLYELKRIRFNFDDPIYAVRGKLTGYYNIFRQSKPPS